VASERRALHASAVGISWRSAPSELRDQCLLPTELANRLMADLRSRGCEEVAVLSTCNRVEVWAASPSPETTTRDILDLWDEICHPDPKWRSAAYLRHHEEAVDHVFRVAASVDSLVLGETQIPTQVRKAWEAARDGGHCGFFLGHLVQNALVAGKRVRTATKLGEGALSISSAAVDLARKIAGNLERLDVGIVGAGEMAELALVGFVRAGAKRFVYLNRTEANANRLNNVHPGRIEPLERLDAALAECDVLVSATGATGFVVTPQLVKAAMKGRRRPIFLLDIAAPRDIDPLVSKIDGVFLYGIDDLEQVVDKNRLSRTQEARAAEAIVQEEVERFRVWWRSLSVLPLVAEVRERTHAMARAEVDRFLPRVRNASEDEVRSVMEDFAQALANKFLHQPTSQAKRAAAEGREPETAAALRELFLNGDGN
jgi:glutamyl-tRNA reductase